MTIYKRVPSTTRWAAVVLLCLLGTGAVSQQPGPITSTSNDDSLAASTKVGTEGALPAAQLIELLREKPELMIDLKKLAAEQLQAQGVAVQEDSITDEMLLGRIVSDASLRANLTLWLRARGYISATDIEQSKSPATESADDDDESSQSSADVQRQRSSDTSQLSLAQAALAHQGANPDATTTTDFASLEATREMDAERMETQPIPSRRTARKMRSPASDRCASRHSPGATQPHPSELTRYARFVYTGSGSKLIAEALWIRFLCRPRYGIQATFHRPSCRTGLRVGTWRRHQHRSLGWIVRTVYESSRS